MPEATQINVFDAENDGWRTLQIEIFERFHIGDLHIDTYDVGKCLQEIRATVWKLRLQRDDPVAACVGLHAFGMSIPPTDSA